MGKDFDPIIDRVRYEERPVLLSLDISTGIIGVKHDQGKPKVAMVFQYFPKALTEVAKCGTFGTAKYGNGKFWDHNWNRVENGVERYSDAMIRHFLSEPTEGKDPDTELLHAAHVAWNALARLELMLGIA